MKKDNQTKKYYRGKLIVIDGTDGSGKSTQIKLLIEKLKSEGFKVKTVHFPEYSNFFGGFIGECLTDKQYNFIGVHPKIVSALYAADRWESSMQIKQWLEQGYLVILDRYVSANQIHQGGKIKSSAKRATFLKWLDEMEHGIFKIPRPDITIYLSLPLNFIERLISERNKNGVRDYAKKKKDVHEVSLEFQKNSRKSALWLSTVLKNFIKIDCAPKKELLTREGIHGMVYKEVKKVLS